MKIGIFGGTFDPIHNAHLAVAKTARDALNLDRVLVIPAAHPPHKPDATASFEHRYKMVELACRGISRLEPSLLEAGEERSYSIRTIEKVKRSASIHDVLYFIIGADAFGDITTWHRWEDVVAAVEFAVVTRPEAEFMNPSGARTHLLSHVQMPVSSSGIREALARGSRPVDLPGAVYAYIVENGLYRLRVRP